MATLGSLTLKIRSTRKLLALDLLQSQQEVERFRETANDLLTLKTGVSIDWDSFSKAESEIRRWVDSLPNPDLQVTAAFKDADLTQGIKDLERLLNNPLKIQVDDQRLFELNEHFKLKERDYRHLQSVLDSPLAIKVDRSQLDNLSRDLRAIENTPQVNLRANVDLDSLRTFHEQLNRYTQGRTLELATSVSRTTLNALQNDLKSLASNLTTARVSVQIDSQLQALRSELGNLPNTRVQIGVDVDDRRLRDLEILLDRVAKPHKLRLNLPSTLAGITSEVGKLAFSPITLPIKLAQNAIGSLFTGAFEGIGKEISREFGQGISAEIKNILTQKVAAPETLGRSLIQNLDRQYGPSMSAVKVPRAVREIFAVDAEQVETDRIINKEDKAQREQKRQKKAAQIAKKNYGAVDKEVQGLEYLLQEQTANSHDIREQLRPKIEANKPLELQRQQLVKKVQQSAQGIGSIEIESKLISNLQKNEQKYPVQIQPGLETQTQRLQQLDSAIQRAKDRVLAGHDDKVENRKLENYIKQKVVKANGNPQELQQLEQKMAIVKQQAEAIQTKIDVFQSKVTTLETKRNQLAISDEKYILADRQTRAQANIISPERIAENQSRQQQLPRRKAVLARQEAELKQVEQQIATAMTAGGVQPLLEQLAKSTKAATQTRQELQAKKQEQSTLKARLDTSHTPDSDYLISNIVQNVANISGVKQPKSVGFARNKSNSVAAYDNISNQILLPPTILAKSKKNQLLDYGEVEAIVHEATHAVQYGFGDINADKDKPGRTLLTPSRAESDAYKKTIEKSTSVQKTQKRRNLEKDAYVFAARNTPDIYRDYLSEYLESQHGVGGNNYATNIDRIVSELGKLKQPSNSSSRNKKEYTARVSDIKTLVDKIAYIKQSLANPSALATDDLYDLAKNKIAEIKQLESQLLDGILRLKSNIATGKPSRSLNFKAKNQPSNDIWDDNYDSETSPKTRNRSQRSAKPVTAEIVTTNRSHDLAYQAGNAVLSLKNLAISQVQSLTIAQVFKPIGAVGSMVRSGYQGLQGVESALLPFLPFGEQLKSIGKNIALPAALYAGVGMLPGGAALQASLGGTAHNLLALPAAGAVNAVGGAVGGAFGQIPLIGAPITHAATTLAGSMLEGLIALATPIIAGKGLIGAATQGAKLALPPAPEYDYVSAGAKVANKAIAASQSLVSTEIVPYQPLPAASKKPNLPSAKSTPQLDLKVGTPPPEFDNSIGAENARSIIKKHIIDIDKAIVKGAAAAAKNSINKLNAELARFQSYVNGINQDGSTKATDLLSSNTGNIGNWKKIAKNQAQAIDYIEMDVDAAGTYNPQPKSAFRKVTERYKRNLKNISKNKEGGYFDPTPAANSPVAKAINFLNQPIEALNFLDTPVPNLFDQFKQAIGLNRKSQPPSVEVVTPPIAAIPIPAVPIPDKTLMQRLQVMQERERRAEYRSRPPSPDPWVANSTPNRWTAAVNLANFNAKIRSFTPPAAAQLALPPARPLGRAIPARGGSLAIPESSALTPYVAALPEQLAWTNILLQLSGQPSLPQGKPEYLHGTTIPPKPLDRPIPPPFPRNRLLAPTTVVPNIPRAKVIQQIPDISDPWIEAELKGMKIEQELDFDRAMGTPTQSISLLSRLRGTLSQAGSDARYYANGAYQQAKAAIPNTISALRNQIGTSISNGKKRFTYSPNKHNQNYLEHSRQEGEDIIEPARAALNYQMERPDLLDTAKLKTINKATEAIDTYSTLTQKDSLNNKEVAQLKQAKKDVKGYLKDLDFQFAEDFNAGSKLNYILKETGLGMLNLGNITKALVGGFAAFTGIAFVGGIISKIGGAAILAAASFQDLKLAVGAATSSKISADKLISRSTTQANQLGYNYQSAIESDASFAAATKGTPLELVSGNISTSLRQYNRVLGVSEERQKLSQIAVQQMAGKGTLAAEEVFGQLAESSPGAVNVLARSQGLTLAQLRARMQEGGLNSADTLSTFGMQLHAESVNSVDGASKSTSATIGKVQNSILSLQTSVGNQLLAPATAGLNTFNDAIKLTESNTDSIAKLTIANFAVLGTGALMLAGKFLPFKAGFDTIGAGFTALGPHLLKFVGQAALVYAALETISGIWGQFQNTSPLKGISDDLDVILEKSKKGAGEAGKSPDELRSEKFSKNLSTFEQVQDNWRKAQRTFGADVVLNSESRADQDTITAAEIIDKTQAISDAKPDLKIAQTQKEREGLALELSILRARRANLTSRDRDELDSNSKREQQIIDRQATLQAPITKRQSDLEAGIKANRAIADDPLATPTNRARSRQRIAEDEAAQRQLQAELSRSSDKITDLTIGLRKLTFESSSALRSIDQNSQIKSTQTYQSAILDPRNTGGLQSSQAQIEIEKISARRDVKQAEVNKLRGKLTENSDLLAAGNINPDTASKEQLDHFKTTNQDGLSQQLVAYVQQYQQAKQDLLDSNQGLFQAQYNYIKSLADYNKGSIDQVISLQNRLANLSLTARNAIASLQQQVEQTLVEINTTSSKAVFQSQRNQIQGAYNKFLEKLGISTDDIFEQLFTSYNSILDTVQQLVERRLGRQSSAITAKYRQVGNETRKDQTQTEQTQSINELKRQESERRLGNPNNQLGSGANQSINSSPGNGNTNLAKPVDSNLISSGFGMRKHPVTGEHKIHEGTDYPVPVGTTVKAAGEGVVAFAGTKGGYGYAVDIKHSSGETTRYAHLSQIGVQVGQAVTQGQSIGLSGGAKGAPGSGISTGAHLHFETRNVKGEPIDPVARLEQNNSIVAPVNTRVAEHNDTGLTPSGSRLPIHQIAGLRVIAQGEVNHPDDISSYYEGQDGRAINPASFAKGFPATPKGQGNIGRYQLRQEDWEDARKLDPSIPNNFLPETQDKVALAKLYRMNRGGKELDAYNTNPTPTNFKKFVDKSAAEWETKRPAFMARQGQTYSSLQNIYRNVAATSAPTTPVSQSSNPPPVVKGTLGEAILILNNVYQQRVDQQVQGNVKLSNEYVGGIKKLSNEDTKLAKKKKAQETNLFNQQDDADRIKLDTQILQNQNQLNRNLPGFNRKSTELENQAAAYNRSSNNRDPYKKIDDIYRKYGGIPDTATQDTAIVNSQSSIERIKEESRVRRENLLKQIQSIEAQGAGWANLKQTLQGQIQSLKKNGFTEDATALEDFVSNNDKAIGTPKARQRTINQLSRQYHDLPSDGIAVADAIAPGTSKVLTNIQGLTNQYLPKTFQANLDAEARSIIERFKSLKEELQSQLEQIDGTIKILESEIQTKLKAAGYAPQKLDLTDPERLNLLRKVAPEETAVLEQTTAKRKQLNLSGQNIDRNAETAAARSVSIGQKRQQLQVDGLGTDYLAATQDGFIGQIQVDKQRFTQGKAALDLEFPKLDATNVDLYNAKLKQLGLTTDTLRNSMQPLRAATTGFFNDIFSGQGVFDGLGNAIRNLTINILKNFQDIISKQLGQQLFGSLEKSAQNIQNDANNPKSRDFLSVALQAAGLATPGAKPNTNPGIDLGLNTSLIPWSNPYLPRKKGLDIGLNNPILPPPSTSAGGGGGSFAGFGLNLGLNLLGLPGIPGFATGGMVTSPTLALVGEGINNEAIVPLPNGRSIPVDLKGAGESGGGSVNSSVSVTIQNSGQAKETSRGEGQAISQMIKGAVMDILINERRTGGILN